MAVGFISDSSGTGKRFFWSTIKKTDESEISRFSTYIFGLPFLNPEDVGDCFAFNLVVIKPTCDKIDAFCDYLVDTYIAEDSILPPNIIFGRKKTTNACESFYSKYSASFYSP